MSFLANLNTPQEQQASPLRGPLGVRRDQKSGLQRPDQPSKGFFKTTQQSEMEYLEQLEDYHRTMRLANGLPVGQVPQRSAEPAPAVVSSIATPAPRTSGRPGTSLDRLNQARKEHREQRAAFITKRDSAMKKYMAAGLDEHEAMSQANRDLADQVTES